MFYFYYYYFFLWGITIIIIYGGSDYSNTDPKTTKIEFTILIHIILIQG